MTENKRLRPSRGLVVLGIAFEVSMAIPSAGAQEQDLDRIQRLAFTYFLEQRDEHTGLVYNTTEPQAPASPTACGVALSAIPIGIERGWIRPDEGYRYVKQALKAWLRLESVRGFFYHFVDPRSGKRTWNSEVSAIDSSVLFAGAMVAASYFKGTEVEQLANRLIGRAEWTWFLGGGETLRWGWRPETGFEGDATDFSEAIFACLLALGSPTHPLSPAAWDVIKRPITRPGGGVTRAMVYVADGSLFEYVLPLAWFDLRNRHDAYLDYWTNAQTAILSNIRYCRDQRTAFKTYRQGLWGLSAALGPDGYKAYGARPAVRVTDDGTVAPYIVAASVPWFPDMALTTYRRMAELAPALRTRYGLGNALNLDRQYACQHTIALDQGLALLMIENARTGLIWNLFMRHPVAQRALRAAGFAPGRLEEPIVPAVIPGNPGASMTVPMMDHAVTIDADLQEWIRREAIELSPAQRRHVESGSIRDARDASALIYVGWTPTTFYLAGIVNDDELVTRFSRDQIYQDDCIEVFWDLDRDGFRFDGNAHDVQLGLAPGGPDGTWQLWMWGALNRRPSEVQAAVKRMPGRYLFELAVPTTLLPGLAPGVPVRFSVAVHDRDRDLHSSKLTWSVDTSTSPGVILFGHMTLEQPQTLSKAKEK